MRLKDLEKHMEILGISEDDIVERFVRSPGKGGQNVNKVSTCVYLKHLPTGIEVKCSQERSQYLNRVLAREILVRKIEKLIKERENEERERLEKLKREKRRRSREAKEKMLREKHIRAEKKALRRRVDFDVE